MTPGSYTEATLVQKTTADYLESLGWESVNAFHEHFGPTGLLGRASEREVVLTRDLRDRVEALNPSLPSAVYDEAVRQLAADSVSQTLAAVNREKYALIRDGVAVKFKNAQGRQEQRRLRAIDFEHPENNRFLCVRELWVQGELYRRRADIVGFVNGLPLLFMELKNVNREIRAAYEENFQDYKDTVPRLFQHNAFVVLGNGVDAKLGSLTSRFEHFHEWKRLEEEAPGVVDMETLLKGVCSKTNFLDLLENFIVFDDSAGSPRKILARNHQFLGVNRAVAAVRERKSRGGKLGVFWHTQGSGKSYSMVFFTRKVHRKLGGNFTFLILTDREDLDAQIYKTFAACGVANNDRDPCRAASGEHLSRLLSQNRPHIFSLIQKFNRPVTEGETYSLRNDIIVISDEAHRSQYGGLALNMRNALPNASYIGFTGTPLFKDDELTRRVFGEYVSTYDFQRAVEDRATVPLYYEARGDRLRLAVGDLNQRIAEKLEELETSGNLDVEQRLERDLKREYHILTATKRLEQVAEDFVDHFSRAWESGKAMLVCIDKVTCVRMHGLIERFWRKKIEELEKGLSQVADEQEAQCQRRQIAWMRETRMAVVVSEDQGEVEKFRRWDLDIIPHRRLMKEGMALPESMRGRPEYRNMGRLSLEEAFKAEEHPFCVAIVCAMWLTGFDVPCLSTLYLDKPLKAHTLMQAIARANRVNKGKNNGMIVDYCGILKHLRRALADFAGTGDSGRDEGKKSDDLGPARSNEELLEELREAIALVRAFLEERGVSLTAISGQDGFARNAAILAAKEAANENDKTRKRFEILCQAVFAKFKANINNITGINQYREEYESINIISKSLQKDREQADISEIIRELRKLVDGVIETQGRLTTAEPALPYNISGIDFERLRREFERSPSKRGTVQNLKTAIEKRLQRLLLQNPLRADFQKRFEEVVAAYNREKDRVTIEQTFDALLKIVAEMSDEECRAKREDLDEESLAVFDLLKRPNLTAGDMERIKTVAKGLLATLKADKLRVDHWRDKEGTRDAVRQTIYDYLWDDTTGLGPPRYSEEEVQDRIDAVFLHVFRAYPTVPSPCYAVV